MSDIPGEVGLADLGLTSGDDEAPQFFTDDFIAGAWGLLGYGIGPLARDLDRWKLEEDEADDLTKRTKRLINSIDKKALKKLEKKYGKHLPALSLVSGVAIVFGSRAWDAMQERRAKRVSMKAQPSTTSAPSPNESLPKEAAARSYRGNGNPSASGPSVSLGADGTDHSGASRAAGNGSASIGVERPLSRAEVAQAFDVND